VTPDEIRDFLARHYPQLIPSPLRRRDGWSFYLGKVYNGPKSTRIVQAVRSSFGSSTQITLSVSTRLGAERTFVFRGDEKALRQYVDEELRLYKKHFANRSWPREGARR